MRSGKPLLSPSKIRQYLGFAPGKRKILEAALLHPSYRNENQIKKGYEDFDRLEFFGDSILNYVVCKKIYRDFPDADEGMLSKLRSILVSRKILIRLAQKLKLARLLKLGKSLGEQDFMKSKLMADSLEAIFGAIYLERGLAAAEKFILKHFRGYFDARKLFRLDPNPKSTLQELSQKHWQRLPEYSYENVPEGARCTVAVDKRRKASASGTHKRDAEEKAARLLIRKIRQELLARSKKYSSGKKARKIF